MPGAEAVHHIRSPPVELGAKSGNLDALRAIAESVLQLIMEPDVDGLIGAGWLLPLLSEPLFRFTSQVYKFHEYNRAQRPPAATICCLAPQRGSAQMTEEIETQVFIVGGGPVGLTLAMDLASRGIETVVAEMRESGEPPSVKCNHVSARSMEIFRRLGVADAIRAVGLPEDYDQDVSYRTTTTGIEITRITIPSRLGRKTGAEGADTWWPTPEPPHRVNQVYLEPVLFEHAAKNPRIRFLNRTKVRDFVQDSEGVSATAVDLQIDKEITIRATFLIGCDGGHSMVRKTIGSQYQGDPVIQRTQSTFINAPKLIELMEAKPAWCMFSLNPRRPGNVYAIDGNKKWLIHNYLRDEELDFESVDRDLSIRTILGVGRDFEYEVLSKEDWYGRRLVADKFREGRVFICGDAAHLWVPYAGYGMNAGLADAANLAWLLSATIKGWAPLGILDAHEAERLPITEQVSQFAMKHAADMAAQRGSVPQDIEAPGPEGDARRAALGKQVYELNLPQYAAAGLNFGYYYDESPIIKYDDERHPVYSMGSFQSSTVPGCRTPHFFFKSGQSLYDELGQGYTLLKLDSKIDVAPLLDAATSQNVPFKVLDISCEEVAALYKHKLVLVRPDQHVAWRGDVAPEDAPRLIAKIRGVECC